MIWLTKINLRNSENLGSTEIMTENPKVTLNEISTVLSSDR